MMYHSLFNSSCEGCKYKDGDLCMNMREWSVTANMRCEYYAERKPIDDLIKARKDMCLKHGSGNCLTCDSIVACEVIHKVIREEAIK